jgi:hypothetical protein
MCVLRGGVERVAFSGVGGPQGAQPCAAGRERAVLRAELVGFRPAALVLAVAGALRERGVSGARARGPWRTQHAPDESLCVG